MDFPCEFPRPARWLQPVPLPRPHHLGVRRDTCTADINLGLSAWIRGEKLRLNRINAPELRGASAAKGRAARDHLKQLVEGRDVWLQTIKDRGEKYGRYLAELWVTQPDGSTLNVNDAIVAAGHAKFQKY